MVAFLSKHEKFQFSGLSLFVWIYLVSTDSIKEETNIFVHRKLSLTSTNSKFLFLFFYHMYHSVKLKKKGFRKSYLYDLIGFIKEKLSVCGEVMLILKNYKPKIHRSG